MGYLKNSGFILLALPQPGVAPLQLLLKSSGGTIERLNATVEDAFIPQTVAPPEITNDQELPGVEGQEELSMSVQADVGLLRGIVQFFKMQGSLSVLYEKNRTYSIKLDAPKINKVNIVYLAGFISDAKLSNRIGDLADKVSNGEVYVITEAIKTERFHVESLEKSKSETGVKVQVPQLVDAGADTLIGHQHDEALSYNGAEMMTFAIKACRIYASGGGWFTNATGFSIEPAKGIERVREGSLQVTPLVAENSYVNL